jgi:hypothetical protein
MLFIRPEQRVRSSLFKTSSALQIAEKNKKGQRERRSSNIYGFENTMRCSA